MESWGAKKLGSEKTKGSVGTMEGEDSFESI